jgi:uncharacterized protein (TIRG00374 family)
MRILRIALPIVIGVGLTAILFYNEFDSDAFEQIRITWLNALSIVAAFVFMFCRDVGLSWRMKLMCKPYRLSWGDALKENLLCEFSSATTPSAVGGSSLIALYLKAYGIPAGKGIAITITTVFMDELFFVLACPFLFFFFPSSQLFGDCSDISFVFIPVYIITAIWTAILYIAIFQHSDVVCRVLIRIFRLPILRRWLHVIEKSADDLRISADEMHHKSVLFWGKAFLSTSVAWTSRFLVAGALLAPFIPVDVQPLAFARQLVMWMVMVVSPTPGGSGVSEYVFSHYYSGMVTNASAVLLLTCLWRVITYYVYLAGGLILLPGWITKLRK